MSDYGAEFRELIKKGFEEEKRIKSSQFYQQLKQDILKKFKTGDLLDEKTAMERFKQNKSGESLPLDEESLKTYFDMALTELYEQYYIRIYGQRDVKLIYIVNSDKERKRFLAEEEREKEEWELYGGKTEEWEEPLVSEEELNRLRQTVQERE